MSISTIRCYRAESDVRKKKNMLRVMLGVHHPDNERTNALLEVPPQLQVIASPRSNDPVPPLLVELAPLSPTARPPPAYSHASSARALSSPPTSASSFPLRRCPPLKWRR